jgi:hypothetical protein
MGWYGADAVDAALKRTKKALIEPFNFWKWIRLGIILFFIGSNGFLNFNSPANYNLPSDRTEGAPSTEKILNQINQVWEQYNTYILIAISVIIFLILLFILISSIMEFVFVESLVTNRVAIREPFKKYLRPGFHLFIIQVVLGIVILSLFILLMLPIMQKFLEPRTTATPGMILGGILWFIAVMLLLAVVSGFIKSFISLAIPVAIYQEISITTAIRKILGRFREDWKQILVYWAVRVILWIVASIAVGLVALILFVILVLILLIPALMLYFMLSALGHGTGSIVFWALMIPYGIIAAGVLILLMLIVSVPVPTFMKYHLLTFLQRWYPTVSIPLFDSGNTGAQPPM